jgi:hypothetical protein
MMKRLFPLILLLCGIALNSASAAEPVTEEILDLEGLKVIGNQELPKSLMIVPWKRSELGELLGHSLDTLLDAGLGPLDRDVFRRELDYYRVGAGLPLETK